MSCRSPRVYAGYMRSLRTRGQAHLVRNFSGLSTTSALLVCSIVAVLFASSMMHYSTRQIICGLSIAAMFTSIVSLTLFLREVYFATGLLRN
jgi:hypothetical protein